MFRNAGQSRLTAMVLSGFAVIVCAQAQRVGSRNGEIAGLLLAAIMLVLVVRALRWSVVVSAEHVQIRGLMRTRTVSWVDIHHFSVGRLGFYPRVGIAHLDTGKRVAMTAIETPRASALAGKTTAEEMINELNRMADERRGGPVAR